MAEEKAQVAAKKIKETKLKLDYGEVTKDMVRPVGILLELLQAAKEIARVTYVFKDTPDENIKTLATANQLIEILKLERQKGQ